MAVAGTIGFAAERAARAAPISLSPLLYATAFGMAIGNTLRVVDPKMERIAPAAAGIAFAKRPLLLAGIILYGAKVTFGAILGIGTAGMLTDLYAVASTLALGFAGGRLLGLSEALTTLIATGSGICGCSAVAAAQPSSTPIPTRWRRRWAPSSSAAPSRCSSTRGSTAPSPRSPRRRG